VDKHFDWRWPYQLIEEVNMVTASLAAAPPSRNNKHFILSLARVFFIYLSKFLSPYFFQRGHHLLLRNNALKRGKMMGQN
jgi:hypothetical protein